MTCTICQKRPPRRHCPALDADICAVCCGEERERSIDCPFDCEYLMQAREREPRYELPREYPNQDLDTSDLFIRAMEPLLLLMASAFVVAASRQKGHDLDLREALGALIAERRGMDVPALGERAEAIRKEFNERYEELRARVQEEDAQGFSDRDVVRGLAFLQREELQFNNRRPRGRAYLDWLRGYVSEVAWELERRSKEAGN
jgi:hypothetical protein